MKRKNILLIDGHPNPDSFCTAIAQSYLKGATDCGVHTEQLIIRELDFNPVLQYGYQKRSELEPDLIRSQEKIRMADHLVFVHPVWWGGLPAPLKGFIDRTFLPGFAFKYRENSVWWDKLLTGKTAHILTTMDNPSWYYRMKYSRPSINQLKKSTLEFCGIAPVKVNTFGPVRNSTDEFRKQCLLKAEKLGRESGN